MRESVSHSTSTSSGGIVASCLVAFARSHQCCGRSKLNAASKCTANRSVSRGRRALLRRPRGSRGILRPGHRVPCAPAPSGRLLWRATSLPNGERRAQRRPARATPRTAKGSPIVRAECRRSTPRTVGSPPVSVPDLIHWRARSCGGRFVGDRVPNELERPVPVGFRLHANSDPIRGARPELDPLVALQFRSPSTDGLLRQRTSTSFWPSKWATSRFPTRIAGPGEKAPSPRAAPAMPAHRFMNRRRTSGTRRACPMRPDLASRVTGGQRAALGDHLSGKPNERLPAPRRTDPGERGAPSDNPAGDRRRPRFCRCRGDVDRLRSVRHREVGRSVPRA